MCSTISYRHNVMTIQSIDTFFNIKGGYYNGLRDVYFVRALGELPDMQSVISEMDQKMDAAVSANRIVYHRVSALPVLSEARVVSFYSEAYVDWIKTNKIELRATIQDDLLKSALDAATKNVIELYRGIKGNVTDTIIKNFTVKLWYWLDMILGDTLTDWTERKSIKIVADNVTKVQEYLFYYMITMLGCDVLMINNKADIKTMPKIKELSFELKLGNYGKSQIPKYVAKQRIENKASQTRKLPQAKKTEKTDEKRGNIDKTNNTVRSVKTRTETIDNNVERRTTENSVSLSSQNNSRSRKPASENEWREKTFEELAQLASSIVMIAVHDMQGNPVATGSGIMIGKKGFILTNCHVIRAGKIYAVRIEDDEEVYVTDEVIKYNTQLDLAVIRINKELKPLPIYAGKKKLVRGQKVVAIGSPLGLFNSVSDGIISGFRSIGDVDMIQFTAPISHGSSGGAVLNMYGEIIGISTAGIDSGQNINLAVNYENIRMFAKGFY